MVIQIFNQLQLDDNMFYRIKYKIKNKISYFNSKNS
jgi:hypothetical protein